VRPAPCTIGQRQPPLTSRQRACGRSLTPPSPYGAAPWCGHCKALAPKYEKAATRLAIKGQGKVIAKCDAIENEQAKEKYQITGFPSLKIFKHGKPIADYPGQRETDAIVAYIDK
jgi:protein disulfide-isomerase A1